MDRISLYRKYRPHNFENLVGQDHIKTTLVNAIKSGQISQAYIFSGPRGTGKTTSARLMAKAINCENLKDGFEPCDECSFCKEIKSGSLIDVVEMDAASNTGVDDVRFLKEAIAFAPSRAKSKVFIIDEFHMLSKNAFNALLKTLEEPPSSVYFVLATTELHKIPETIVSRCQNFEFKRISNKELSDRLAFIADKENIKYQRSAIEMISKFSNGGMRDAIGIMEQVSLSGNVDEKNVSDFLGISGFELLNSYYETIRSKNTIEGLKICERIFESGVDLRQFYHDFINLLREKITLCFENNKLNYIPLFVNLIETFQKAIKEIDPEMPKLSLEMATIKATFDFQNIKEIDTNEVSDLSLINSQALGNLAKESSNTNNSMKDVSASVRIDGNGNVAQTGSKTETEIAKQAGMKNESGNAGHNKAKSDHSEAKNDSEIAKQAGAKNDSGNSEHIQAKTDSGNAGHNEAKTDTDNSNREHRGIVNSQTHNDVNVADLKQKWISVLDHIKKPSIQNSLRSGKLVSMSENVLLLSFMSDFHKDIVMKPDSILQIESSMEEVLGLKLQIKSIVESVDPMLSIQSKPKDTNSSSSRFVENKSNNNIAQNNSIQTPVLNNNLGQREEKLNTTTNGQASNTADSQNNITAEALKIFDGKLV